MDRKQSFVNGVSEHV